jgi:GTP cyclohydrolase I
MENQMNIEEQIDHIGDNHIATSSDTPLRDDAFLLSDSEKIQKIEAHFRQIMEILGLDLTDDSLSGTPHRVAKLYVNELFSGLNPKNKPKMATFDNKYKYSEMLVEKNITMYSSCEHHFLPIIGKAHVGYISSGRVIGLSKINRICQYFGKRPQVQERLAMQIANELKIALSTQDVIVVVEGEHLCVSSRGINDTASSTITIEAGGKFKETDVRKEFLTLLQTKLM